MDMDGFQNGRNCLSENVAVLKRFRRGSMPAPD
jgi:hypothetical protein